MKDEHFKKLGSISDLFIWQGKQKCLIGKA